MNQLAVPSLTVYLALGTNLGDRASHLAAAQERLSQFMTITALSAVYETPPWGYIDQPAFLNMALAAEIVADPGDGGVLDLLAKVKEIEMELGRQPTFRNGPRVIDIDILFYGDLVTRLPGLVIPHPRIAERQFVLIPLADIAPDLIHPVTGQTVRQMLDQLDEPLTARRWDNSPEKG